MNPYWKKKATPWVTVAVLAGGMLSAVILFWLVKLEDQVQITTAYYD